MKNKDFKKEALLYEKLDHQKIKCQTCAHRCVIPPGKRGICGVRENQDGKLYFLAYGKIIACHVDPIEKKPLFHFLPGTYSLSIATVGCNFRCLFCQNADISQASKEGYFFKSKILPGEKLMPEQVIEEALRSNCPSISYTYTEPTIFLEYAFDTMKLAKKKGLKNNFVSNGFMTEETIRLIAPYLDAINIDLKSFSEKFYAEECGARLKPVLDTLKLMKKLKIWTEVTTLIIPLLNDSEKELSQIAKFIAKELGQETPWHISRFYPTYKLTDKPYTPLKTIHKACQIGKKFGLKYVYAGNTPGDENENTFCPECHQLVIQRLGYQIQRFDKNGFCPKCGTRIDLVLK